MKNYAQQLWYVLIRFCQQEVETAAAVSEYYDEGFVSHPPSSNPSLFAIQVYLNPYLVPHTERLVSSEAMWFSLKAMLGMNIETIIL